MNEPQYVLGVDGGNSKTDYLLFDKQGRRIDSIRAGTCSHEQFSDAYAGSFREMNEQIAALLARLNLTIDDIAAGAFGLAGADIPSQKEQLCRVVERIGFRRYALDNDSFLGIKAGSARGYGICSINGSGMVVGGISPSGHRLQIGGVGSELSGDEAGGYYLARKVLRTVYDALYRLGPATSMTAKAMALLQVPDKSLFIEYAVEGAAQRSLPITDLVRLLFTSANEGDKTAIAIVDHSANQLARSTAGCLLNLDFEQEQEIDVVLAGSVWIKADCPLLFKRYRAYMETYVGQRCNFIHLQVPPAAGAVLWALELVHGQPVPPDMRERVIAALKT